MEVPKFISLYSAEIPNVKKERLHLFGKQLTKTKLLSNQIKANDDSIFLNGAIYGQDSFVNGGKAIVVGCPFAKELLNDSDTPTKIWTGDFYVRKKPVGISISLSRFEGNNYINILTPENVYFDAIEKEMFKTFGDKNHYEKIVEDVLDKSEPYQKLLGDISTTKSSFLHFFFHVTSPKLHYKTEKESVYLMDIVNNTGNGQPIQPLEKLYECSNMYKLTLLPLASEEVNSLQSSSREILKQDAWQYIIYFDNYQIRFKLTNSEYRLQNIPDCKNVNELSYKKISREFVYWFFDSIDKKELKLKPFISNLCQRASTLKSREEQDFALANIESLKRSAEVFLKKVKMAECYACGLMVERGILNTKDITQNDRAWFSSTMSSDVKKSGFHSLVWSKLNNSTPSIYSVSKFLELELDLGDFPKDAY